MTRPLAIYPGSFDPPHLGHLNIIERALSTFDKVLVAVLRNPAKTPVFTPEERAELLMASVSDASRLEVAVFDGLLVDFVRQRGGGVVLRGLRAVSDFEYEFQMATMNRRLAEDVETLFMMTDERYFYLSSRLIREVASLGGDVRPMLTPNVYQALVERLGTR